MSAEWELYGRAEPLVDLGQIFEAEHSRFRRAGTPQRPFRRSLSEADRKDVEGTAITVIDFPTMATVIGDRWQNRCWIPVGACSRP